MYRVRSPRSGQDHSQEEEANSYPSEEAGSEEEDDQLEEEDNEHKEDDEHEEDDQLEEACLHSTFSSKAGDDFEEDHVYS